MLAGCEGILAGTTAFAVTKLTDAAVDRLLATEWRGTWQQKMKIEHAANSRAVLGPQSRLKLERSEYANSPIISYLKKYAMAQLVSVAYVPNGMGKTTACHAFLDKYVQKGLNRGLCFSPHESNTDTLNNEDPPTFFDHMVSLLGFDGGNVPAGLLGMLMDSLPPDNDSSSTPSFLFLDDFMRTGPNASDCRLLLAIKTLARTRNIAVIVLTSNQDSADFMLTMNSMVSIRPPLGSRVVLEIKDEFVSGNFKFQDATYHLDWAKYMDQEWPTDELKKAAKAQKDLKEVADIDAKVDKMVSQCTTVKVRKQLTPHHVIEALREDERAINPLQTLSTDDNSWFCFIDRDSCAVM